MSTESQKTENENSRPIIGILAQGIKDSNVLKYFSEARGKSYIAASYVKFVESAGGRVVPISDQSTDYELEKIFKCINGIVLPGGGASILNSPFANAGKALYERAKEANEAGTHFPILGICLGFELMVNLVANKDVRCEVGCEGTRSIQFTEKATRSRLFKPLGPDLIRIMTSQQIAYHHHKYAFKPDLFTDNQELNHFFDILALSKNDKDYEFIAAVEAKKFPFYGLQCHPEKCQFEWKKTLHIDHSPAGIEIGQRLANFFIGEARKNANRFETERKENESLIWNHLPLYTGDISEFEQIYII